MWPGRKLKSISANCGHFLFSICYRFLRLVAGTFLFAPQFWKYLSLYALDVTNYTFWFYLDFDLNLLVFCWFRMVRASPSAKSLQRFFALVKLLHGTLLGSKLIGWTVCICSTYRRRWRGRERDDVFASMHIAHTRYYYYCYDNHMTDRLAKIFPSFCLAIHTFRWLYRFTSAASPIHARTHINIIYFFRCQSIELIYRLLCTGLLPLSLSPSLYQRLSDEFDQSKKQLTITIVVIV